MIANPREINNFSNHNTRLRPYNIFLNLQTYPESW